MATGDGALDLIAGVYKLAVRDAQRGHVDAVEFLDDCAPDWRLYTPGEATERARFNEKCTKVKMHMGTP